ncbi:hypothetical protein DFP73DRAFT_232994 [Morchella snyderi]|nr:hypothetical protein DFP73DRAFT_232994 [Morchella snyderi]
MPSARPAISHPARPPRHHTPAVTRKISKRRSHYDGSSSSDEGPRLTFKRVSCCTAGTSSNNPEMKMRAPITAMDPVVFDNLPPAVRRKYFSSLERLRYAQQQHTGSSLPPSSHGRSQSSHSAKHNKPKSRARPSFDSFRSNSSLPQASNFILNRPPGTTADEFILSQADAKWYLELPETIRRKHFSREERILLASKCESIIVDAADETIYRIGRQANRSLDTVNSLSSSSTSRASSLDLDGMNAVEEIRKSFRWMEEDGTLDLRLDEFYSQVSRDTVAKPLGKPSIQRTMSLSSRPYRAPSSHSSSPSRPSLGSARRPASHSMVGSRQKSIHSIDKDAAYYQDPEARLKLRVYLASPQKFDEAIEFGFPSATGGKDFFKYRPNTSATIRRVEPGLDDYSTLDSPLFDNFDDTETSSAQNELLAYHKLRDNKFSEFGEPLMGTNILPSRMNNGSLFDPYLHAEPGNREMTLRMTLTRKDLRADENELYGWKKDTDPLALEELPPVSDSDAGQFDWGNAGKESDSGLKRLWRRITGGSR